MCLLLFFCVYERIDERMSSSRKSIAMTAKKPQIGSYYVPLCNSSL